MTALRSRVLLALVTGLAIAAVSAPTGTARPSITAAHGKPSVVSPRASGDLAAPPAPGVGRLWEEVTQAARMAAYLADLDAAVRFVQAVQLAQLADFLASLYQPDHSDAWWYAIAVCESGATNGWRTGYFGLENRAGVASMSYEDQRALARWIHSWAGDSAWGCAGRAWAAVPGG